MIATYGPTSPPKRSPIPVPHMSAGRYLTAHRYVVGWQGVGLVKIGCTSNIQRVRRFVSMRDGELIDLAWYDVLYHDVRAEVWLDQVARTMWPGAFRTKDDARKFMGRQTGGWTEFLKVPVSDWPELRRLAAI